DGVARGDAQHRRRRGAVVAVGDGARRGGEPMEVLGGERRGGGREQQKRDERSVHAGTYAGTPGTATNVHFVRQRTITMRIEIATRDGLAPSYVFRPEGPGKGPWPAVLVFMDGIGIRPAMLEVGERLATYGYFVLLPDLYYRSGPYAPMKARLEQALTAAGVDHVIETYPARHGFVLRDTPAFDAAAEERHWRTLTQLLEVAFRLST